MGGKCQKRAVGGIERNRKTRLHENKKQRIAVNAVYFNSNGSKTRNGISYRKRIFKALHAKY